MSSKVGESSGFVRGGAPIRRIVTGHSEVGIAKVIKDEPATNAKYPGHGVVSTLIWCTEKMPADITLGETIEDMGNRILGSAPPKNGTRFAVIDFPPGNPSVAHRTETIDYVICLSGTIDMEMDDSTVTMEVGDVMVQRGTNHAWVNRGKDAARVAFVLIDAEPLGIGEPVKGAVTASSR